MRVCLLYFSDTLCVAATSMRFYTANEYIYNKIQFRVDGAYWAPFKVRACNDAHIALFDHHLTDMAYEIVFGSSGNQWTVIRKQRLAYPKAQVSALL